MNSRSERRKKKKRLKRRDGDPGTPIYSHSPNVCACVSMLFACVYKFELRRRPVFLYHLKNKE
ncbi:Uncharacterized protein APZ42_003169 [Daphnia magna]|uniref:Uncharacterized protein n=1 Tax=Daphnia magna TaxID=35525 RepID=A0A162CXD2_9CRUS|nr:Uncharacterized protein APZ42_003169 [Daphnia magna]